jgi:hypothetical protein
MDIRELPAAPEQNGAVKESSSTVGDMLDAGIQELVNAATETIQECASATVDVAGQVIKECANVTVDAAGHVIGSLLDGF